jgi:hypothetical protein
MSVLMAASFAAVLAAQPPALEVKMGLWEITSTTDIGGQMPAVDTSKMTPEQKAQVEAAMKAMMGSHANVTKSCMTKEKFQNESFMNSGAPGQNCKQTLTTNTPSALEGNVTCTGDHPMAGQIRIDALSPTSVKGMIKSEMTEQGRKMTVNVALTGKWLGADCGKDK